MSGSGEQRTAAGRKLVEQSARQIEHPRRRAVDDLRPAHPALESDMVEGRLECRPAFGELSVEIKRRHRDRTTLPGAAMDENVSWLVGRMVGSGRAVLMEQALQRMTGRQQEARMIAGAIDHADLGDPDRRESENPNAAAGMSGQRLVDVVHVQID